MSKLAILFVSIFLVSFVSANQCEETEGYLCSPFLFGEGAESAYRIVNAIPEDYGLSFSEELSCPSKINCYKKLFSIYSGGGNYTLSPGDEVQFDNGYIVKYINFQRDATWNSQSGVVTGNLASIALYKGPVDYSNLGQNFVTTIANINNIYEDKTKTFANGFWLYAEPLGSDKKVKVEIFMGSLSSCIDSDSYVLGNTTLEFPLGKWGRNYYKKGATIENIEDENGQHQERQEDVCVNGKLIEYYCDNNELAFEEKTCECVDKGSCRKGFFDSVREWLGRTLGYLK